MTCVPHGLSHYRGKARCRGAHSERARDLDDDGGGAALAVCEAVLQKHLRHLGRLTAAGVARYDENAVLLERVE